MTWLRRMLGRELSPEEMEKAKNNFSSKTKCFKKEYFLAGTNPSVTEILRKWKVTPDASFGMECPHSGFYECFRQTRTYTPEGRLISEVTLSGEPFDDWETTVKVFDPPGRIIGRKLSLAESQEFYNNAH